MKNINYFKINKKLDFKDPQQNMYSNKKIIFFVFILVIFFLLYFHSNDLLIIAKKNSYSNLLLSNDSKTRDFNRYDCQNLKRIGGGKKMIESAPNDLYR